MLKVSRLGLANVISETWRFISGIVMHEHWRDMIFRPQGGDRAPGKIMQTARIVRRQWFQVK